MASYKFTYYLYLPGYGKIRIYPLNSTLRLKYYIDEWEGFWIKKLEGSFFLGEFYFNILFANRAYDTEFWIYENGDELTGTVVYNGFIKSNNNFDFNTKICELKNFTEMYNGQITQILQFINDEKAFRGGGNYIIGNSYQTDLVITSQASTITAMIQSRIFPFLCTLNNFWYNFANVNIGKIRIAPISTLFGYTKGSNVNISLNYIFKMLEYLFKIYWYEDSGYIKFKTLDDFKINTIDLSAIAGNLYTKTYEEDKNYLFERIKFSENNQHPEVLDWDTGNQLEYNSSSVKILEYDLKNVMTKYDLQIVDSGYIELNREYKVLARTGTGIIYDGTSYGNNETFTGNGVTTYTMNPGGTINYVINTGDVRQDGLFLAYVNEDNSKLEYQQCIRSGNYYDNAFFSAANIHYNYYRNYIYCDYAGYKLFNTTINQKPAKIKPFIKLADLQVTLGSIANFYDSVIYRKEGSKLLIGRTYEQTTDLESNITTFKCYEFENTIN